jgi:lipopolysaccharide/colanic/teichoic acid biosynthesis glycosyltransferase
VRPFLSGQPSLVTVDADGTEASAHSESLGLTTGALAGTAARVAASRSKRAFDLAFAGSLLVVASPLIAAIAIGIRLSTPGPVLFRQQRVGREGRPFTLLKFRTMDHEAPQDLHERFVSALITAPMSVAIDQGAYKLQADPRVTRIGRWLRRMSLDELPQLINVLRGEMSIVGPRPPLEYEVVKYEPWQHERLVARPGLTGLWQVSGRNRLTYTEMCRIDIDYVRSWSFRQDMRIISRTPWVMFVDRGGAE